MLSTGRLKEDVLDTSCATMRRQVEVMYEEDA